MSEGEDSAKPGEVVIDVIEKVNKAGKKNIHVKLEHVDIAIRDNDGTGDGIGKRNAIRNRDYIWHTRDIAYTFHKGKEHKIRLSI